MPAVEVVDLVKEYKDTRALDQLSLTVEDGELFGLLGPNGAGKTTFINILVGLARPTAGEARVFGHDVVDEYQAVRDRIGLSPQEFNVDRFFSIKDVLAYKAGYHGHSRVEAKKRALDALETVGLEEKADTRFSFLSGGMKRRVLLARALVTDPDLLILDEPTAGVDVQLRREIWDIVRELNSNGTTVLLTTHYIEEAERLCDRVCILDEGSKVAVETPDGLMAKSADTFRITLDETADGVDVSSVPGLLDVQQEGDTLMVRAKRDSDSLSQLLTCIVDAGYRVVDIGIERASLEDVFVNLTRLDN